VTVVARVLAGAAERFGDLVALAPDGGRPVTYAALWEQASSLAAGLGAEGFEEGAVVALDLPSDPRWVAAYGAVSAIGGVAAGINPRLAAPERAAVLERLDPDLVLDADRLVELGARPARPPAIPPPDPERVACVVFTSGTTGEPKGAVFRERQLDAIARIDLGSEADEAAWGGGGPMLASTQFCHIGFTTKLPWYLRTGTRVHVLERWRPADALRVIAAERMAGIGGVAAHIGLLLRVPDFDSYDLSAVRTIVVGAGPSPAALVHEARHRFGAAYSIRYSSTESGGVGTATAFDADDDEALHTVGHPRPGVSVRVDPDDGELQLSSPAMTDGYWRDPERTAAAFTDDGWLHTGDLAAIDERGLVRITGRATDMYIRGGYNVHPAEVEAVLLGHPAVAAVAVVPRADDVLGEVGVAVVVPAHRGAPSTVEDLRSFAGPRLAAYKLPEALVVVDELPLTSMDKIDRRALHQLV
jgi:acyl-CoA synthetase (AMP-forming)/AMP-acid ligase II